MKPIQVQPGEQVVGRGEPVGTVYRLDDGRTVLVESGQPAPAEGAATTPAPAPAPEGTTSTPTTPAPGAPPATTTTPAPTPTEAATEAEAPKADKGK